MSELDAMSKTFSKNSDDQDLLALAMVWVGFKLYPNYHPWVKDFIQEQEDAADKT